MVKVKQASLMCFKPNTELYVGRQNVGRVEGLTSPFWPSTTDPWGKITNVPKHSVVKLHSMLLQRAMKVQEGMLK